MHVIHRFTRRGVELRFEAADKGGDAGAPTPGTAEAPVETRADQTPGALEKPTAEFLRMIPGAEQLIDKQPAAAAPKAKADETPANRDAKPAEGEGEGTAEEKAAADAKAAAEKKAAAGEDDDVPEDEAEKPHVKKMVKRIGKLTAKAATLAEERDELKAERDALQARLAEAEEGKTAAPLRSENPLASIRSGEKLDAAIAHAEKIRDWALSNWDGATVIGDDKQEKELSAGEVREIFKRHDEILRKHAPAQRAYLAALNQNATEAAKKFPWLKDKDSEAYQLRQSVLAAVPELQRFPDFETFIGEWVHGHLALKAAAKAGTTQPGKKPTPVAPAPPAAGTPPPKVPQTQVKQSAALEELAKHNGSPEALANYFAATSGA